MEELRFAARRHRPEVVITTANVGFFVTRLMLLFGQFNYGRRGILDRSHRRLFTFGSLSTLLEQSGYQVIETRGVPAPFPLAVKTGWLSRFLLRANDDAAADEPGVVFVPDFRPRPGAAERASPARTHAGEQQRTARAVCRGDPRGLRVRTCFLHA